MSLLYVYYIHTPLHCIHIIVCREMTGAYIASDTYNVQLKVKCEILKCMGIMQDNLCHISNILSTTIRSDTVLFYFAGKFACHLNQLRYVCMLSWCLYIDMA